MKVMDLICGQIDDFIADPLAGSNAVARANELSADIRSDLELILSDSRVSYRDGVLIQFAYGIVQPELDLTLRPNGARSVAKQLGVFLADRHIRHVKDAYQNIGKNSDNLARGNFSAFDNVLEWANKSSIEQRNLALQMACAVVASTARPVQPMPPLDRGALTFARVTSFLGDLLTKSSGGAFQQFSIGALLHSFTSGSLAERRVETKNLNASDRSSYAAGDVQIVSGNRVIEALEVTANLWDTKIASAGKTIRDNDLSRLHIVAARPASQREAVASRLLEVDEDVSVLDVQETVGVLVAVLTRSQRADALVRLYEYLDRYQPDVDLVNLFVDKLKASGLAESGRH